MLITHINEIKDKKYNI